MSTVYLLLLCSYVLGSLPFGLWIGIAWKGVDIRKVGSGNIGATNVWRVCGRGPGLCAFLLDVGKGFVPPFVGARLGLSSEWQIAAALLAVIGHTYSIFLGFKGGKGIATGLGALLGIAPKVAFASFILFVAVVGTLRYMSLASILAAISLPILMPLSGFYPNDKFRFAFALVGAVLAVWKHRSNISRLIAGTEPRIKIGAVPCPIPDTAVVKSETALDKHANVPR